MSIRNTYYCTQDGKPCVDETYHGTVSRALTEAREEVKWEGTRRVVVQDLDTREVLLDQQGDFA